MSDGGCSLGIPAADRCWLKESCDLDRLFCCAGHLAQAVKGLNPKINIWTTGNGDGPSADSMAPLRNLFTTLPPLVSPSQQHEAYDDSHVLQVCRLSKRNHSLTMSAAELAELTWCTGLVLHIEECALLMWPSFPLSTEVMLPAEQRMHPAVQMDAVGSQAGMRMPSWAPQMPIEDQAKPGTNAAPSMPNRGQTPKAIV